MLTKAQLIGLLSDLEADFPPLRYRGRVYIRVGPRKAVASKLDRLPGATDCADRSKLAIDLIWFDVMLAVHIHTSFMHPFGFALVYQKNVALKEVKTSGIYGWRVALRLHPCFDGRHRIDVDPDAHYRRAVMF